MEGKLPSLLTSKAIKTWDTPDSSFFLLISLVESPPDKIAAKISSSMLGGIHPMIQNGKKAKEFREKQGIKFASREGLFVIFGYPKVKFSKGIQRTFASVYTPN